MASAADALSAARASLEAVRSRVDDALRREIDQIQAQRAELVRELEGRLAGLGSAVTERVYPALMQARAVVEREIDHLSDLWIGLVRGSQSMDELRAAVSLIEREAPVKLGAAHDEARRLFSSALAGGVHDLFEPLLSGIDAPLRSGSMPPIGDLDPLPSWDALSGHVRPSISWLKMKSSPRCACCGNG